MTDAEIRGFESNGLVHFVWSDEFDTCYARCAWRRFPAKFVKLDVVRKPNATVTCFECLLLEVR